MGATSLVKVGGAEGAGEFVDWANDNAADKSKVMANKGRPFIRWLLAQERKSKESISRKMQSHKHERSSVERPLC